MISFKRISIKNFKRYRQVEIKPNEKKGLFVFLGKNYLGKSTFLNAICWCLYDEQPFKDSIEKNINYEHSLLNEDAKRINPFDDVRVELEIEDDSREYLFVRTWRNTQQSQFQVMLKKNQDWSPLTNSTVIVETLLPKNLREYFIFAGEDAEGLFKPGYEKKLKAGVWKVSNIEVLDRLIDHLETVYSELQRETVRKGANDITKEAVDRKAQLDQERISKSARVKELSDQIQEMDGTRLGYFQKMKANAAYSEKIKRRMYLENRRNDIKQSLDKLNQNTNNLIIGNAPFVYLSNSLAEIVKQLTTDEEAGDLPPAIRAEFINRLLKSKKCICGNSIKASDGSELKLKKLLEDILPADRRAPLLEDRYPIQEIIRSFPFVASDLDKLRNNKVLLLHEEDQIEKELKNISEELCDSQEMEISGLEEGLKRVDNTIDEYKSERAISLNRLNEIAEQIKQLDEQIKKETSRISNLDKLRRRLEFLEIAKDNAGLIRQRITDRVRKTISKNTENYFRELFWDQSEYESIKFSEDYKLEVDKSGFAETSTEFSTGEKKVLGIATLRAIADLSGFSGVPIFFDAPLTNFGPEIEKNVLDMLPRLAPNKQLFIFNLDTDEIKKFAQKLHKGHVFELKKDPKSQNSTIIQQLDV